MVVGELAVQELSYSTGAMDFAETHADAWASAYSAVAAGAALVAGLGVMTYMKRS